MLKIAICDDEEVITTEVETLLEKGLRKRRIQNSIDIFFSGEALLNYVAVNNDYDIIYMDIEMAGMNGIMTAKILREKIPDTMLIFISGYENYYTELFEVEPFRFIKKPVNEEYFQQVLYAACDRVLAQNRFFTYTSNKLKCKIPIKDIIFLESRIRIIRVHMTCGEEKFYGKLNDVEKMLHLGKIHFLRIHQSYLVNMNYVRKMGYDKVILYDGTQLQISEERQRRIKLTFPDWWEV